MSVSIRAYPTGLAIFVAVSFTTVVGMLAQAMPARFADEFVSLSAFAESVHLYYARPHGNRQVQFVGFPTRLYVRVINNTQSDVEVDAGGRWWERHLRVEVDRSTSDGRYVPIALDRAVEREQPIQSVNGRLLIRRGREQGLVFRLRRGSGNLAEGVYRIQVELAREFVRGRAAGLRNIMMRDFELEVRRPSTTEDWLDFHLKHAEQALLARNFIQSRMAAQRALALNPSSAAAYAKLAQGWRGEGNCEQALTAAIEAARIVRTDADPILLMPQFARDEWAEVVEGNVRRDCSR